MSDQRKFRVIYERIIETGANYVECAGLHTELKPTDGICTGSLALEVDTGDLYAFDEVGAEWDKIAELGGGS